MNKALTESDKHHARAHLQAAGPFIDKICREPFLVRASREKPPEVSNAKLVHWIRHGQGFHNLMSDMYREHSIEGHAYARLELHDPPLTAIGRDQAAALCSEAQTLSPALVVVSPLARATKTALIAFDHLVGKVPFVAHELCREISGINCCDSRRSVTEAKKDFPAIDYSLMPCDTDEYFHPEVRETQDVLAKRAYEFLGWLRMRDESEIVVGTHSAFLFAMLNLAVVTDDEEKGTGLAAWFAAGEMRSAWMWFEDGGSSQ
eukprot:TRINITY_DN75852_c0_g1_i1.p1 TRINITY_DN75852_c0_g1~~TRINITY_DN75852_c0_g1_i1.p1  ORF type:complete len:261 (-),score=46.01 TRINITY_DN75852_c0_g1_i1:309-1091(-)